MSEWISVKDRLPEPCVDVLVFDAEDTTVEIDFYMKGFRSFCINKYVTHWMPLPEPPKGD